MSLSAIQKSLVGKTPSEMQAEAIKLYSSMPPDMFFEHLHNAQFIAERNGREKEQEEIVCRLLESGIPADEVAIILSVRLDVIKLIEHNNAAIKIPNYSKKLKERRQRRRRQTLKICKG